MWIEERASHLDASSLLTEVGMSEYTRLIATVEECDAVTMGVLRSIHGFKVMKDESTAGEYILKLKAVEEVVLVMAGTVVAILKKTAAADDKLLRPGKKEAKKN